MPIANSQPEVVVYDPQVRRLLPARTAHAPPVARAGAQCMVQNFARSALDVNMCARVRIGCGCFVLCARRRVPRSSPHENAGLEVTATGLSSWTRRLQLARSMRTGVIGNVWTRKDAIGRSRWRCASKSRTMAVQVMLARGDRSHELRPDIQCKPQEAVDRMHGVRVDRKNRPTDLPSLSERCFDSVLKGAFMGVREETWRSPRTTT
jgi:hypothetical protein